MEKRQQVPETAPRRHKTRTYRPKPQRSTWLNAKYTRMCCRTPKDAPTRCPIKTDTGPEPRTVRRHYAPFSNAVQSAFAPVHRSMRKYPRRRAQTPGAADVADRAALAARPVSPLARSC